MEKSKKLTERESAAINIMKAFAVLSVIAAHVVPISETDPLSKAISSAWNLFGRTGVIIFFAIGGFLYDRAPGDGRSFWKKKTTRIILPWLFCGTLTYGITVIGSWEVSFAEYLKWIFGSGTWYYYMTVYLCFLFVFRWLREQTAVLCGLVGVQIFALTLASFDRSTTPAWELFTDYLNPLHWIGYFSLGVLIKRYRLDHWIQKRKSIVIGAYVIAAASGVFLCYYCVSTYFHIGTFLFCVCWLVIAGDVAYRLADKRLAKSVGKIGTSSYCIYLLHMQIVQRVVSVIPDGVGKLLISPFIGLGAMLVCISIGLLICRKLPFGEKIKKLVGL